MAISTLKGRINKLTFLSLFLVVIIMVVVVAGYSYIRYTVSRTSYIETLKKNAPLQSQEMLPTLLVEEQFDGLDLILNRVKKSEELDSISFVPTSKIQSAKSEYGTCTFIDTVTDCHKDGELIVVAPVKLNATIYGYIVKSKKIVSFSFQSHQIYFVEILMLILLIVFLIQFLSLSRLTGKEVPDSLNSLLAWIDSSVDENGNQVSKPSLQFMEFNNLAEKISTLIKEKEEQKIQAKIGLMASQVSHDIRSPLAALKMITDQLTNIPEETRILIRSSVARINDISNELLSKGKEENSQKLVGGLQQNTTKTFLAIHLLSPLIDSIISEKRIQFREKQGVEIEADLNYGYGLFANVNATELKRAISNLITNAVEAFPNNIGKVIVTVRKDNESEVSIVVQDNGKGIPEYILKKLGELGVSHGKESTQSGSGLGVYHAKKTIEDSSGKFQIQSREGAGATITMTFNKATAPKWFVEKLVLAPGMVVTSLDDDISIHQIWKGRFESKKVSEFCIKHTTFTSGPDFKTWVTSQPHEAKSARLYLVDYELLNQISTGLDIIEDLKIGSQSILVTSRYEEDKIRERCERLGVSLIPKVMAGFVPIEIAQPKALFDGILLDDDWLVHSCWAMDANNKNKHFVGFYNADDFFSRSSEFNINSKVFVDSNLGNGVKGELVSQKIHELGFTNIYLCTGYQALEFKPMAWIKGIVGKDPFPELD